MELYCLSRQDINIFFPEGFLSYFYINFIVSFVPSFCTYLSSEKYFFMFLICHLFLEYQDDSLLGD